MAWAGKLISSQPAVAAAPRAIDSRAEAAVPHRLDIDGLRAVAVLAVVAYHADSHRLPGGFIGVDVFFVISGYLITGILLKALEQGSFSLSHFYARRVRRLFPALSLVLLVALLLGWKLQPADGYAELGKQVLAGCAFVSNLLFWHEAGYFDTAARLKPLLHLWSLGVEEQFYICWPLLLAWAWRRGYALPRIIAAILIASFVTNVVQVQADQAVAAFYSPFTRFWELMSGCLLATLERKLPARGASSVVALLGPKMAQSWLPGVASVCGIVLLAVGFAIVTADSAFPGWYALLPTGGTFLVIAAGPLAWPNRWLLSQRLCVFTGEISYPLYLWHWVLLVFLGVATIPTRESIAVIVVLSYLLAWLTFVLLERPIRTSTRSRRVVPALATVSSVLAVAGLVILLTSGVPGRFSAEANRLAALDPEASYRYGQCFLETQKQDEQAFAPMCQDEANAGRTTVLLWGDSHAAHLYPGLRKLQDKKHFRLIQLTATACPPLLGADANSGGSCARINRFVQQQIVRLRPAVVILGDRWSRDWSSLDSSLKVTADFLRANGVEEIFAIGTPPRWDPTLSTAMFWFYRRHGYVPDHMQPDPTAFTAARAADRKLEQLAAASDVRFVSAIDALCGPNGCITLVAAPPEGLISADYDHFSPRASEFFIASVNGSGALQW